MLTEFEAYDPQNPKENLNAKPKEPTAGAQRYNTANPKTIWEEVYKNVSKNDDVASEGRGFNLVSPLNNDFTQLY